MPQILVRPFSLLGGTIAFVLMAVPFTLMVAANLVFQHRNTR